MKPHKDTDVFLTASGIPVKPVYLPEDAAHLYDDTTLGEPGKPPYTRGIYPQMYRTKPWTIRQFTGFTTPEETNRRFKYEHAMGQTGFSVAFDAATENGLDSDDPRVRADVGAGGVPTNSIEDMAVMFEGLPIERVNTGVIGNPPASLPLSAMYFAMAETRGIPLARLGGTTQNDILLFTVCNTPIDQIPPHHLIRLSVDLVEWCAQYMPKWNPVSIASYNYRENGINAYQELAFMLANAIAYLETGLQRNRLTVEQLAPVFSFHLAAHNDFFEEIAKFRAARRMWYRLMHERYKVQTPRARMLRFHVQTAGSTHTYQQPLNNLVRIAYQVLAAALGGAQSIHANSYDEALCLPTERSVLLSIRTQQIAQLETNVTNVVDPVGGSFYLEHLTNELEERAWDYLKQIEEQGGLVAAIASGWVHREWREAMEQYGRRIANGEIPVVGVNCLQMDEEPYDCPVFRPDPKAGEIQAAKLAAFRQARNPQRVQHALDALRRASEGGDNVMPAVLEAVKAHATLGEICGVWRQLYAVWNPSIM
jgi:methylmalonyl-CoA mutase N-terminal domain/subunit